MGGKSCSTCSRVAARTFRHLRRVVLPDVLHRGCAGQVSKRLYARHVCCWLPPFHGHGHGSRPGEHTDACCTWQHRRGLADLVVCARLAVAHFLL